MDMQKIEPLLMDYALGATTPEVAALVEAYQETDSDVRAQVEQWRGVANLARLAMVENESTALPVFPRQELQVAHRHAQWRRGAAWAAALAACLMLGYFAGRAGHDRFAEPIVVPGTSHASLAAAENVPVAAVDNFWSQSRLRAVAEREAAQPARSSASSFGNGQFLLQKFGG